MSNIEIILPLTDSLDGLMSFLQTPVARGITPLHSYGYEEGAFIYETGKCKSVAELIRQASDLGLSPGPRAGLELMTQAMEVLHGALRIAEEYAIFSHGGLTPWRLMIRPDGKLQVIGFAVPQVEVLDYKSNPNLGSVRRFFPLCSTRENGNGCDGRFFQ